MPDLKYLSPARATFRAMPGADWDNCAKEAILCAVAQWKDVEFIHNGRTFVVLVGNLVKAVERKIGVEP
jgi:hypothetical protein